MDKDFHDLLEKYLAGNCSAEEEEEIHEWYDRIADPDLDFEADELPLMRDRMIKNIRKGVSGKAPFSDGRCLPGCWLMKVAAIALILVAFVFLSLFDNRLEVQNTPTPRYSDADVFENDTDGIVAYVLDDGSDVRLYPCARLEFHNTFKDRREVELTGRAYFDVAHDLSRPFYVYTGTVATRVLGTSFIIDAPTNARKIEIKVIRGKVAVYDISDASGGRDAALMTKSAVGNGVELIPNQKVEYFIEEDEWVVGLVEDPVPVKAIDKMNFSFAGIRMKALLSDVEERFGIEVVPENRSILNCTFTGDVSMMSLYDLLDVVTTSIGSTYEVKGTKILLYGPGCD